MEYSLSFEIKGLPKRPNQSLRGNWKVNFGEARKWKNLVIYALMVQEKPESPLPMAEVTLTRFSSSEPDFDGLTGSMKNVLDGLVVGQVIVNDKPSTVKCNYRWQRCKRGEGKIRVEVRSVESLV